MRLAEDPNRFVADHVQYVPMRWSHNGTALSMIGIRLAGHYGKAVGDHIFRSDEVYTSIRSVMGITIPLG